MGVNHHPMVFVPGWSVLTPGVPLGKLAIPGPITTRHNCMGVGLCDDGTELSALTQPKIARNGRSPVVPEDGSMQT